MTEPDASKAPTPDELPSADDFLVVGIGASAGGIRALGELFAAVPADSGIAYVVILHLPPDHESNLAAILQKTTRMRVTQVVDRVRIEPNTVYVVSPNSTLSLTAGYIEVAHARGMEERRAPVDVLFRKLAQVQRTRAVSVVLSGTGANGSMGMKRIKECGGLCIAQEPGEAEFADMPRNAIATGHVDYVLPVAAIPARLRSYQATLARPRVACSPDIDEDEKGLAQIFALLRVRTGHDFSGYKRSTVVRRIERRMNLHAIRSLADYARYVRDSADEAPALLRDLLISVTNFFRDAESYAALEKTVVPALFRHKGPGDQVRAWVAGCATGEEAYSIAMLLAEQAWDSANAPSIQVFATDIDAIALAKARAGLYSLNDAADVPTERLRRFFVPDGDSYRVRRELRELLLFVPHNVIEDPPFSHLDLISCRNVLIYLNRPAQERALHVFHFGLNPGGFLFLGSSELADDGSLFVAVDKERHIYRRRDVESHIALPSVAPSMQVMRPSADLRAADARTHERMSYQELHQKLLERYAPPSIVVDQDYEIVHLSDNAGRYLLFPGGEPSRNLMKVVRPELRLELHSALYHAVQHRASTEARTAPFSIDGRPERLKIVVTPAFGEIDATRGYMLIVFEPLGGAEPSRARVADAKQVAEPIARQLEEELTRLKLQLHSNIEQHELQQEELKASNEELQAINEELRSSSEELETSKEELQSVNEELTTVNQELKIKIEELSEANNDTRNLMNSTDLATIFVDRAMRIKLFTPRARSLFNLIPSDTGRPLLDITHRLRYPSLVNDIELVLESLTAQEREVQSDDGGWYIARVLPYRTADDRIAGVVLTFTDITARKQAEQAVRASEERVRLVVDSVPDYAIITLDRDGRIASWNRGACEMFGYTEQEAVGEPIDLIFPPEDRHAGVPAREMAIAREAGRSLDERWHVHKDGRRFFVSDVMAPLLSGGNLVGYTKVARDLTQRVKFEEELRLARAQLEARAEERTREIEQTNDALRREIAASANAQETRLRLMRQLVRAQEDERRRMSRELHDQLGQEVTALALKLSALKSRSDATPEIRRQIDALQDLVRKLDSDVEFLVWKLRPTGLDDLGLAEALADYAANWSRHFEIPVHFQSSLSDRLPPAVETVLYRIAQEALNNVAKHSRAGHVEVLLSREAVRTTLTVQDDGVGFDILAPADPKSFGLLSMRERASLIGAELTIESRPGAGTVVRVAVAA